MLVGDETLTDDFGARISCMSCDVIVLNLADVLVSFMLHHNLMMLLAKVQVPWQPAPSPDEIDASPANVVQISRSLSSRRSKPAVSIINVLLSP